VKTLADGREVESDSQDWRNECLARHVLSLLTLTERRAWLADFERRRGAQATADLMTAMQLVHAARQSARVA
jgi:hypothetical protein